METRIVIRLKSDLDQRVLLGKGFFGGPFVEFFDELSWVVSEVYTPRSVCLTRLV